MKNPLVFFVIAMLIPAAAAGQSTTLRSITLTLVDDEAIGYGTFQSHNQKVLANQHGIFMTHIRSRNAAFTAQTWRLSRSIDRGKSFVTVYEATHATNPPVIETDAAGNIYLMIVDLLSENGYLYRFLAANNFAEPVISTIPRASAGKYAMAIDEVRGQLYVFSHNNMFNVLGLDGSVRSSIMLLRSGKSAYLQYPHVSMDADGTLHVAWTTQKLEKYLYWDIHHLYSQDGGKSWKDLRGPTVEPPVLADQHGPATRITLDDEFDAHTWLSAFKPKGRKVHFMYLARTEPPRQHYVRYDIATGRREADVQPVFRGEGLEIRGESGFFTSRDSAASTPLYATGMFDGRIVCLVSQDNGKTWQDFASSEHAYGVYALGGNRRLTADGRIIGSFTDQGDRSSGRSKIYFVSIQAE